MLLEKKEGVRMGVRLKANERTREKEKEITI